MNIKQQAFELYEQGISYGNISRKLGIGKTTAYDYVKEVKLSFNSDSVHTVRHGSELRSKEPLGKIIATENSPGILKEKLMIPSEKMTKLSIKEFTGDELIKKKFDSLEFTGKFLELIGKPSKLFSGIIWGLPKGGKSNFALRFADYMQEYFGEVVYIAAEEGESVTLQEKFIEIGGSKVTVAESRNREEIREYLKSKSYDFVFIDSINNAGIDSDYLEILKQENPEKSFTSIVQATKGGNFKGDQALTHNCDFIIKVVAGIAYHTGRFNTATEINIFDEPLYIKNPDEKRKGRIKEEVEVKIPAPPKLKTEADLKYDKTIAKLLSLLPDQLAKEPITKTSFILPLPSLLIKELKLPVLKAPTQKTNLPSWPIKKNAKNLGGSQVSKNEPVEVVLKVAGGLILAKVLYEIFKGDNNQTPKDKEK